ncbi:AbgT family transporter [Mycetocola reblochoni]|uniref:Aminobenzoyl-glutamate transport protein n=2 Tax=Mycetocola reblochoni TaxID=331618 RepID=A0A1R4KE50_9MICO|nr:AbgT family transporter [Mycetocola reblochoni]RLP71091.1 AbgT family transporter [Mycetocola reblochoni]SJN42567.1 Aminobenzoyl-glutamate transport protein [Mycetocola reblochoni REB411]
MSVEQPVQTLAEARGVGARVLRGIERAGNRLPHPFYLFLIIAGLVAVASAIAALLGASTTDPATGERVAVTSILSGEGVAYVITSAIENFVTFPPLGLIVTVMLGIGVAERLGLLQAAMRGAVLAAPAWSVTFVVVLVSLMGNLASDSAMVILPPLAAAAFLAAGRHPLAGFAASYAAVVAGFSANIIPAGTDVLLSGITTSAAQIVDPEASISPIANYYFMATSTLLLAVVITVVCQRYVEPRLTPYTGSAADDSAEPLTAEQKRGLRNAAIATGVYLALLATAVLIPGSPLRGEDGGILRSPFMTGLPVFILFLFLIAGITYGRSAGTLTSARDVPEQMTASIREIVPFIVVIFTAAQAIAWFNWSGIGLLLATSGAEVMNEMGLGGIGGLLLFSLFVTLPALLLSSGSALWTLLAPIFVPMFMLAGVDPAYVQAAFRITDSATNPLVPMNPMLPVVLGLMQRYEPKAGLGTLFSLVIPFTLVIWGVWLTQFVVWGLFGLPVGPGHSLMLPSS